MDLDVLAPEGAPGHGLEASQGRMYDDAFIQAQRGLYTAAQWSSALAAAYMLGRITLITRGRYRRLFVQQLVAMTVVELLLAAWRIGWCYLYWGTAVFSGSPPRCDMYLPVYRWLQMQCILFSASIAVGLFSVLKRWKRLLTCLKWGPLFIPLAALGLVCPYIIFPTTHNGQLPLPCCLPHFIAQESFALEVIFIWVIVFAIHTHAVRQLGRSIPNSCKARSINNTGWYLVAFFVSYFPYCLSVVYTNWVGVLYVPASNDLAWWSKVVRDVFYALHGLLVMLAFRLHLARQARDARVTGFRIEAECIDVPADAAEASRRAYNQQRHARRQNSRRSFVGMGASMLSASTDSQITSTDSQESCAFEDAESEDEDDDLWGMFGVDFAVPEEPLSPGTTELSPGATELSPRSAGMHPPIAEEADARKSRPEAGVGSDGG